MKNITKKFKFIFLLLLVLGNFIIVKNVEAQEVHAEKAEGNNVPKHTAKIVKDEEQKYQLNLDMLQSETQIEETAEAADIVFVLDRHYYMNMVKPDDSDHPEPDNQRNRFNLGKKAIKQIVDGVLTDKNASRPEDEQIRVSLFTSQPQNSQGTTIGWTTDREEFKRKLEPIKAEQENSITHYFMQVLEEVKKQEFRQGAKKYIVFVSSGEVYNADRVIELINSLNSDCFWQINSRNPASGNNYNYSFKHFIEKGQIKNGVYVDGTDEAALFKTVEEIVNEIHKISFYRNVSIQAQLSEFVELDKSREIKCYEKDSEGNRQEVQNPDVKIEEGKKIIWQNWKGNQADLPSGVDYEMQIPIKLSEQAYEEYLKSKKYPNKGDADTGESSAKKAGFYALQEAETFIEYQFVSIENGHEQVGEKQKSTYPKPVVQVPASAEYSPSLEKIVEGSNAEGHTFHFELKPDEATAEAVKAGYISGMKEEQGKFALKASVSGPIETAKKVDFPTLTFAKPGQYTFLVAETKEGITDEWEYDTESKAITISVSEENVDKLKVETTSQPIQVRNQFVPKPVMTIEYQYDESKYPKPDGAPVLPEKAEIVIGELHKIFHITEDVDHHKFNGWVPTLLINGKRIEGTEKDQIYTFSYEGKEYEIDSRPQTENLSTEQFKELV